jgi:modulator of FtsH protease HflK
LLAEYRKAPEVTRKRMYLEAMEEVLSKSSKVLIDVEGGNNLLYLPLDKLMIQNEQPAFNNVERATNEIVKEGLDPSATEMHRLDRVRQERDQRREQKQ